MASVDERAPARDVDPDTNTIAVENPATGEVIATIPIHRADDLAVMAGRAREAQPQWEAIGFDGRARIMRRAQKWFFDNSDRVLHQVCLLYTSPSPRDRS